MADVLLLDGMTHELDIIDGSGRRYSEALLEGMLLRAEATPARTLRLAAMPLPVWTGQAPARHDRLGTGLDALAGSVATAAAIVLLAPARCGAISGVVKNAFDLLAALAAPPGAPHCRVVLAALVSEHGQGRALAAQAEGMLRACGLAPLAQAPTLIERERARTSREAGDDAVRSLQRLGIAASLLLERGRSAQAHQERTQ